MGVSALILGYSGSGKSTSLRNFEPGEIGVFNVAGKPLPFRKKLPLANRAGYSTILQTLRANKLRAYVIDDANYLMAFQNFAMARQTGYGKFTEMAVNFEQLLEAANATDDDTIVYFLMHPDLDEAGRMKPKTIGKMLDEKWNIAGACPVVIDCVVEEGQHLFITANNGHTLAKAPMGSLPEKMDNDLKAVDTALREYWGMKPIKDVEPDGADTE